jgi:hypothetical protein
MRRFVPAAALVAVLTLLAPAAHAQEAAGAWRQTLSLYGMGAAIDGDAQIGDLSLPVDLSISDVLSSLKMGAMGTYRIENDKWSFEGDLTFMNLGFNESGERGRVAGDLDIEQFTFMATAGRRLTPRLEALVSLAYFDVSADLEVAVLQIRRQASRNASWVDPLVGLNYVIPFADKWSYSLRGDIGGFGVGSDLTWQVMTLFRRQNTERFGWYVGYRALAYDYEDGSGASFQRYDLTQQGPMAGIAISF